MSTETYDGILAINVDVQNDFCRGGSLAVEDGDDVVPPLNRLNNWVRNKNGVVVFTRDWHPQVTTHFDKWPVHCVQHKAGAAFHDDLEIVNGSDYFTGAGKDLIASKGMGAHEDGYSGFEAVARIDGYDSHGSGGVEPVYLGSLIGKYMRGLYVDKRPGTSRFPALEKIERLAIVVGGLATDFCVKATVLDALKYKQEIATAYDPRHIGVFALTDAMRAVNLQPENGELALREMAEAGAILTTTDAVLGGTAFELER